MKKKVLGLCAASLLMATSAWAIEAAPQYNCDYQPSCEVGPGVYGAMSSPVTSKFTLSIGGFAKLDYAYQTYDNGNNGAISPNGPIPKAGTAASTKDQSVLSARQSRFWLKSTGPTFLGAKTAALIEGDFYGDLNAAQESPGFRLRHAYLTMDWANTQLLFGQYWDTWGPAIADTEDFRMGSATGSPNTPRVPQIRLSQKVPFNADNSLKFILAVQDPQENQGNTQDITVTPTALDTPVKVGTTPNAALTGYTFYGSVPNFDAQINFESKALGVAPGLMSTSMKPLTVSLFGMYGSGKLAATGHAVDIYGYGVYTFVPIVKSVDGKSRAMTASLEAQGYISAGQSFNSSNAAATANSGTTAQKGYGLYGQVKFFPNQDLGIIGGYGRRNVLNYGANVAAGGEEYNEQIYGHVTYDLNAAVRLATEYQHMRSQYKSAPGVDLGQANVIRLCAYYFF